MYKIYLAILLLISTTHLQAIDDDDVRFTVVLVNKTSKNPYKEASRLDPLLKKKWTVKKVKLVIANKTDVWLGTQGDMYTNVNTPFVDNDTLDQSMKGVSSASKTTFYLQYNDSIKPTYQFIHNNKLIKTIKKRMDYGYLSSIDNDLLKQLKKQESSKYIVTYTYHGEKYNDARMLYKKLNSTLPFLKERQLKNKICKIKITTVKKSQTNQENSLWNTIKNHKLLTGSIVGCIVITIGYLATKKKKAKKPKKQSWFETTKKKVYNALSTKK